MFFCACIAFSLFDFWAVSFDGPVPFLAAWLLFQINIVVVVRQHFIAASNCVVAEAGE